MVAQKVASVMRRVALWVTLLMVVVPSTVASIGFTALALGQMAKGIEKRDFGVALFVPLFVSAGWFGIVTLWRLFVGLSSNELPRSRSVVWAGLASGCVVDLCLVVDMVAMGSGHRLWEASYIAWPMVAALHYGVAFKRVGPEA
jgi:hypothetical protein